MDNLTHTLTGLALSRAGLNRFSPHATWLLILAANAADIDVVSMAGGQANYLHYHRQITHGFAAVPVMALAAALLVQAFKRKPLPWRRAYPVALIGAATHPLLDLTNAYGVRALLPFSGEWLRWDLNHIFDIWIWAILLVAALGGLLSKLVSGEIGAKTAGGRGLAIFALLALVGYDCGRWVLHERAVAVLEARLYEGGAPLRVAAIPGPVNPFGWRGIVETGRAYSLHQVNLLREFDPAAGRVLYKAEPGTVEAAAKAAAMRTFTFRTFLDFAAYPVWRYLPREDRPGALRVEAVDLRFGSPSEPAFVATALLTEKLRVERATFRFRQ